MTKVKQILYYPMYLMMMGAWKHVITWFVVGVAVGAGSVWWLT